MKNRHGGGGAQMKVVFCFVLLLSGTYAFSERDPVIWSRGFKPPPDDKDAKCNTYAIKLPEIRAVEKRTATSGPCGYMSYVEWKDFKEIISDITVPAGDIFQESITIKIRGQDYINGELKFCAILISCWL